MEEGEDKEQSENNTENDLTDKQASGRIEQKVSPAYRKAAEILKQLPCAIIETQTAEAVNEWFEKRNKDKQYYPTYTPGTKPVVIELNERSKFVRVYVKGEGGTGMHGGWVMLLKDIEGLSPLEIRDKYSLPAIPVYVCDVVFDAGTKMRMGEANAIEGWGKGGGIQFDLMGQRIGSFVNERRLIDVQNPTQFD